MEEMIPIAAKKALEKLGIKTERTTEVITFDGNADGKERFPIELNEYYAYVKVSDTGIIPDKISFAIGNNGATYNASEMMYGEEEGISIYMVDLGGRYPIYLLLSVSYDCELEGTTIKAGTYIAAGQNENRAYVSRVEYTAETITPIKLKYLPKGGVGYTEPSKTVFSSALENGIVDTNAEALVLNAGETYTVQLDSGTYTAVGKAFANEFVEAVYLGNVTLGLGDEPDTGESFMVVDSVDLASNERSLFAMDRNNGTHVTVSSVETIHPIDPKYLPEVAPKVIDLDKYGISDIILSLFAQGGGQYESDVKTALWHELEENRPPVVCFSAPSMGFRIITGNTGIIKTHFEHLEREVWSLHFELTADFGKFVRISVMIGEILRSDADDGFVVTVIVADI